MNILLVGEKGNESSSKLLLDLIAPKYYIDKLYLTNELKWDQEQLNKYISHKAYDYIFIFGNQRNDKRPPKLKFIQTADKDLRLYRTTYECQRLSEFLQQRGMDVSKEEKTDQTYENEIYYVVLSQIQPIPQSTKCSMIMLPRMEQMNLLNLSGHITRFFLLRADEL